MSVFSIIDTLSSSTATWTPGNGVLNLHRDAVFIPNTGLNPRDQNTFPSLVPDLASAIACELITGSGFAHIRNPKFFFGEHATRFTPFSSNHLIMFVVWFVL